jgi:cytochrome c oxidase assembly protein subunit 15
MALFNTPESRKPGFRLALVAVLLAVVVVGLGAFTRLAHAGLGCPDWPGCYGHLWAPQADHEIDRANALFPDMPVQLDKTWPEMVHRYFAGGLILLTIGVLALAIKHRHRPAQPLKLPVFILGLILLQALFGMWTVTLKLWPQVVTTHLLGGFAMLSLLWLLTLRLDNRNWRLADRDVGRVVALRRWAVIGLLVVIAQVCLGGWTTSNYAALACPDFPTCHYAWVPEMDFAEGFDIFQHIGPNYLAWARSSRRFTWASWPGSCSLPRCRRPGAWRRSCCRYYWCSCCWASATSCSISRWPSPSRTTWAVRYYC